MNSPDAYGKIGSFLNELQYVINKNPNSGNGYAPNNTFSSFGSYGNYGSYPSTVTNGFNSNLFMEQTIERLARSFNIQLPSCWGSSYGNNNNGYNSGYNNYNNGYNNPPVNNGYNTFGNTNDLMGRIQCVAKSVRLEDFDLSISRMLQQGGILVAAQLPKISAISFLD